MEDLKVLWQLIGGGPLPEEDDGPARRTQIVVLATLASAVMAAGYGAALAGGELSHLLGNLYRMPAVVLLSSAATVPATMLAWRMSGTTRPVSDLFLGLATGTLTGSLVLAALAPLVALYAHTSEWLGPVLALLTAGLAVVVGLFATCRSVLRAAKTPRQQREGAIPLLVLVFVHCLTLSQLIAVSSLMPEATFLDQGLEGLVGS